MAPKKLPKAVPGQKSMLSFYKQPGAAGGNRAGQASSVSHASAASHAGPSRPPAVPGHGTLRPGGRANGAGPSQTPELQQPVLQVNHRLLAQLSRDAEEVASGSSDGHSRCGTETEVVWPERRCCTISCC